ncbi:unnamed protein product, partial [Phaeothamnion confervicola]
MNIIRANLTSVIIIDHDRYFAEKLELIINSTEKYRVHSYYNSVQDAFKALKTTPDIKIVLTEVDLPGTNGIEGIRMIRERFEDVKTIVVTSNDNLEFMIEAFKAGAFGYIMKDGNYVKIVNSLDELVAGGSPLSLQVSRKLVSSFHTNMDSPLSKREGEVMRLMSKGKTYRHIANELMISTETTKCHIRNIYTKLEVNNKSSVIDLAVK